MSIFARPVSEVFHPETPGHKIIDDNSSIHHEVWGYSVGYVVDKEDREVPEYGNTAIFRIPSGGLTEPVFVTKPEPETVFTVKVLAGVGTAILTRQNSVTRLVRMNEGNEIIIKPGCAYSYVNLGQDDLLLHDTAIPAFKKGDDVDLTSSLVLPKGYGPEQSDDVAYTYVHHKRAVIEVALPTSFYDYLGLAAAGQLQAY